MAKTIRDGLEGDEYFQHNRTNLTGKPVASSCLVSTGEMPNPYATEFRRADVDYVIFSYNTPIAWRLVNGVWRFPPVNYSLTTNQHQYTARAALQDVLGDGWRDRIDSSGEEIRMRKGYGPNGRYGSRGDGTF